MNDRDRLAADLHPWSCGGGEADRCEPGLCWVAADRLIALGWTRECEHCVPVHEWPCPTIPRCDEPGCERETSWGFPTPDGYRRTCGEHYRIAITKAYREDTDGG